MEETCFEGQRGFIWTHDMFSVPPTYGGCLILCKQASLSLHVTARRAENPAHMRRDDSTPLV